MSFSPISFISPNFIGFKNEWLKAYEPGTTTPKVMALESNGGTQVAKLQLNVDGFIVSAGAALVIPYIDGAYDLWLFPTEAEADANDTTNAERLADDITGVSKASLASDVISDTSQAIEFDTLLIALNDTSIPINKKLNIKEHTVGKGGAGVWYTLTKGITADVDLPNGTWIRQHLTQPSLVLVLQLDDDNAFNVQSMGAIADGGTTDNSTVFFAAKDAGHPIFVPRSSLDLSYALSNLVLLAKQRMYGNGTTLSSFGGNSIVVRQNLDSVIHGFHFTGSGKDSLNTGDIGIDVFQTERSRAFDVSFTDMGGSGYKTADIVNDHEGNSLLNYVVKDCNIGLNIDTRGEYQNIGQGSIKGCNTNLRIVGGNINAHGTVISDCATGGIGVHLVAGANDAHGQLNGALLNHNGAPADLTTRTIKVDAPALGFLFNGCQMWNGSPIELLNCNNIWFRNCVKQAVAIIEDGCTQCGFTNNDFIDGIDNTPNANASASEVFYLDNNLPPGTATTGANGLGGGFLRLEQQANIINIPVGDTDLDWDTKVSNSITGNLSYTVQSFFDPGTANAFIRADTKFVRMNGPLQVMAQLTIGKPASPAWTADEVTVKILDVTGAVVGYFSPKKQASDPAVAETIRYHFNGPIPRNAFKVVIENNSAGVITLFRHQTGTDILTFAIVTGW